MKPTVLIIDDEVDECLLISSYLRRKEYHVEFAHTLEEGIEKIRVLQPQRLLLDNNLPDGLGWSQATLLRSLFPGMQITLITAGDATEFAERNAREGFSSITKPMHLDELESLLKAA